jgi:transporter family protein
MESWFVWTIFAMITFGFWGFFPKLAISYISPQSALIYQVLGGLLVGLVALVTAGFKPEIQPMGVLYAFLTGITGVLGTMFYYMAASRGQLTIVVSFTALYPLVTILLAFIFLHETISLKQVVGLFFALTAIVLLSS